MKVVFRYLCHHHPHWQCGTHPQWQCGSALQFVLGSQGLKACSVTIFSTVAEVCQSETALCICALRGRGRGRGRGGGDIERGKASEKEMKVVFRYLCHHHPHWQCGTHLHWQCGSALRLVLGSQWLKACSVTIFSTVAEVCQSETALCICALFVKPAREATEHMRVMGLWYVLPCSCI